MEHRLVKIDELTREDHFYLTKQDRCFYVMEYTSGKDYRFSKANSLIKNVKKTLDRKGTYEWVHKGRAIREIASIFSAVLSKQYLEDYTIVPVPSSKCKDDPLHDDRLVQILELMTSGFEADIREILYLEESIEASHDTDDRPGPDELQELYKVKKSLCKQAPEKIIIFDDMITAGAHFRACKNILQELFPDAKIIGVFFTRRKFFTEEEGEAE